MTSSGVTVWEMDRASKEWVGPITVAVTVDGVTVPVDVSNIKFALLPLGVRPSDLDWVDPVPEPGGNPDNIGVQADPVGGPSLWGIWAKLQDAPNVPWLGPDEVGRVRRT